MLTGHERLGSRLRTHPEGPRQATRTTQALAIPAVRNTKNTCQRHPANLARLAHDLEKKKRGLL